MSAESYEISKISRALTRLAKVLENVAPACGLMTSVEEGYISFPCALVRGHDNTCQSHESGH